MRAADGDAAPPWEIIEGQICERFHKFPEELDGIDVGRLMRSMELYQVYQVSQKQGREKLSDVENAILGKALIAELEINGN